DLGIQAHDGKLHNGPGSHDQGLINGELTKSMHFLNSVYVTLPTTGLPTGASSFTLGCMMRLRGIGGAGNYPIALQIGSNGTNNNVVLYFNGDNRKISAGIAGHADIVALASPSDGYIYNVFLTYDGTTAKFYINGVLQG